MTYTLQIGSVCVEGLPTLEQCQRAYIQKRDDSELGASGFPCGIVYDTEKIAARISYNGRLWPAGSWYQGQEPLAEAPK